MDSHMNKERKAGRWTVAVAAKAADQFAEMVGMCVCVYIDITYRILCSPISSPISVHTVSD